MESAAPYGGNWSNITKMYKVDDHADSGVDTNSVEDTDPWLNLLVATYCIQYQHSLLI